MYDGCPAWETAFIVQAYCSTDLVNEFGPTLRKAHEFIKSSQVQVTPSVHQILLYYCKLSNVCKGDLDVHIFIQIRENHPDYEAYYRHRSKGSWTLSTADNGWSVSDCTAEALKVKTSYL